jgi:hypothetical protein
VWLILSHSLDQRPGNVPVRFESIRHNSNHMPWAIDL